jgi:NADH-quinone oxidoreductase subunit M
MNIPVEVQKLFFPFAFVGFGILELSFHFIPGCLTATPLHPQQHLCFLPDLHETGGYGCLRVATY